MDTQKHNRDSTAGGTMDKIKGKAKEVGGAITGNPEKQLEGRDEQKLGKREMDRAAVEKDLKREHRNV